MRSRSPLHPPLLLLPHATGPLKYDKLRAFLEPFAAQGKKEGGGAKAKKREAHEEL